MFADLTESFDEMPVEVGEAKACLYVFFFFFSFFLFYSYRMQA